MDTFDAKLQYFSTFEFDKKKARTCVTNLQRERQFEKKMKGYIYTDYSIWSKIYISAFRIMPWQTHQYPPQGNIQSPSVFHIFSFKVTVRLVHIWETQDNALLVT